MPNQNTSIESLSTFNQAWLRATRTICHDHASHAIFLARLHVQTWRRYVVLSSQGRIQDLTLAELIVEIAKSPFLDLDQQVMYLGWRQRNKESNTLFINCRVELCVPYKIIKKTKRS